MKKINQIKKITQVQQIHLFLKFLITIVIIYNFLHFEKKVFIANTISKNYDNSISLAVEKLRTKQVNGVLKDDLHIKAKRFPYSINLSYENKIIKFKKYPNQGHHSTGSPGDKIKYFTIIKKTFIYNAFVLMKQSALVVELVDTKDLKSLPLAECRFESGRGHHL